MKKSNHIEEQYLNGSADQIHQSFLDNWGADEDLLHNSGGHVMWSLFRIGRTVVVIFHDMPIHEAIMILDNVDPTDEWNDILDTVWNLINTDSGDPDPQPPITDERIKSAIETAKGQFFGSIAHAFPEIEGGDIDPMATHLLDEAMEHVVRSWIDWNE